MRAISVSTMAAVFLAAGVASAQTSAEAPGTQGAEEQPRLANQVRVFQENS